ncbi:HNH endonuclease [Ralstonia pseudosolanacearum]|uniref:HNH endonuclease n=1 Tax=Ralstonia pseudosolanacearum TaxID=1310165 RepID=UPI001FFAE93C|nr:HNH endonuclease [Ralstonia pseudosolanacearum]
MTRKENLKPKHKQLVSEVTAELGIEMTSQYDWCFGDPDDVAVVFIWYESLRESDRMIYFTDDTSEWVDQNRDTALTVQKNRAEAVGNVLLKAYWKKQHVRVAIVDGTVKKVGNRETSEAQFRELDTENWYPHHRDPVTQQIVVVRGVPQSPEFDAYLEDHPKQSTENESGSERRAMETTKTTIYERDPQVVRDVKKRAAGGRCEYCGKEGFLTPQGGFYLEAHHVIPLHCGGADQIWNVVALCADDHRQAHFGKNRHTIRDELIVNVLDAYYPERYDQLEEASLALSRRYDADLALEKDILN